MLKILNLIIMIVGAKCFAAVHWDQENYQAPRYVHNLEPAQILMEPPPSPKNQYKPDDLVNIYNKLNTPSTTKQDLSHLVNIWDVQKNYLPTPIIPPEVLQAALDIFVPAKKFEPPVFTMPIINTLNLAPIVYIGNPLLPQIPGFEVPQMPLLVINNDDGDNDEEAKLSDF